MKNTYLSLMLAALLVASTALCAQRADAATDPLLVQAMGVSDVDMLEAYAAEVLAQDANAVAVDVSGEAMVVAYRQRAKLLAFIPITMTVTSSVAADGKVSLSYPWYSFLVSKDYGKLKSDIEVFAGRIAEFEDAKLPEVRARIIEATRMVMRDSLEGRDPLAEEL